MNIEELSFAERFNGISGSAIREIFKLIARPDMISFAGGNPSPSALPDETAAEISRQVLEKDGKRILQYGATEGYPPFLESLKPYAEATVGCELPSVLPTSGSTQGMDLLCKALINPGDVILVENPSFIGNLQCMRLYQARPVGVESDDDGLIPEALEEAIRFHHPRILYVIPNFQNPTGRTLSVERRRVIAEMASRYGVIVAEDDPYRDLRYCGQDLPSIKSFDRDGWVVFLGSFSKIVSPGLRVGYMAGHPALIRKCVIGKQSSDLHTPNLNQAVIDQFLRRNLLPDHILKIRKEYSVQLQAMLKELEALPEGFRFTRPEGGLFIWMECPEGMDCLKLLQQAVEKRVAYVPGTHFYPEGGHLNTLRLNFSNSSVDQIHSGMQALREVLLQACC